LRIFCVNACPRIGILMNITDISTIIKCGDACDNGHPGKDTYRKISVFLFNEYKN
jgi:hypothetical protein